MNIITLTSGKGGVGKSVLSANLAKILADEGYKICLLDGNLSFGNLDTILNVNSEKNILDFLKNEANLQEILLNVEENLYLIPGYNGEKILDIYDENLKHKIKKEILEFENFDFLFIDTSNPFLKITQDFIDISDEVIVITTPEPPAIINTYTTLKVLLKDRENLSIIANMSDENEREFIFESLKKVLKNNINKEFELDFLGGIKRDKKMVESTNERTLIIDEYPCSITVNKLRNIASNLLIKFNKKAIKVEKISDFQAFIRKILDLI
ncbi:MinD/ParA family protein [Campylobacter blaseri]|uniref:ATP-binding protein n=1 Tax=Campylobacter blaseri TaxID=2042961 RepID=A0A2P8QZ97_9BACT|nr:P-loop NTPase [Campylobacter blaseri]PSM51565.1 ATP-binding protein [Campylobacter blaseri]PSM53358.1 ATP-binding protein [Campylobacter blaseri]QKF86652.1 MinD/ParA family protein [Campylobacter blaseri]